MKSGTVTISIEEFDELRNFREEMSKLPKVTIFRYSGFSSATFSYYTTDESQREMMDSLQNKINEYQQLYTDKENEVRMLKDDINKLNSRMYAIAYSRKERRAYKKTKP
jgi:hypothetical protein